MKRIALALTMLLAFGAVTFGQENPIATIGHDPGWCTIFHRWGFIGDSLCSGEHEYLREDGQMCYHDIYEYSWGQRMVAAIGGATGENYSQGGETAKGWIDHFWDYPQNRNADIDAKRNLQQAYIIALGCNDRNTGIKIGDARTDINKEDYKKNADTFIGYYAGIIQRVKSLQPKARFFVVTMPNFYGNAEISAQIRQMPEIFDNVYCIDLEKYAPDYTTPEFQSRYFLRGHMNAAGYQFTAWMFMTYINWIVEHKLEEFTDIALI